MALFHLHVTQVKRSAGQSVVTSAAYRAGEKLYSEYYGEVSDYTHKGGVVCTDILLPPQAPNQYQDRATLWNAVEKAERGKKAQLAYSFDIALQNEFSLEENIALARQFVSEQLVGRGMIADFAIHQPDKEDGGIPNPHFHVLCPIRPIEPDGKWGCKQRRRYSPIGSMCVLRSFIPSQQKKTARPRMFRHFVPSRWLHPLAPLMRLSPVYFLSADGFKNRPPPASLITKMKN